MLKEELVRYIRSELEHGMPKDTVVPTLVAGGWPAADVQQAFAEVEKGMHRGAPAASPGFAPVRMPREHHFVKNTVLIVIIAAIAFLAIAYYLGGQ